MTYCWNCDTEAIWRAFPKNDWSIPLCETCKDAFEWGQQNPEAPIEHIDSMEEIE
jgi:hypothetical protein